MSASIVSVAKASQRRSDWDEIEGLGKESVNTRRDTNCMTYEGDDGGRVPGKEGSRITTHIDRSALREVFDRRGG